jgi:hypothetical protein
VEDDPRDEDFWSALGGYTEVSCSGTQGCTTVVFPLGHYATCCLCGGKGAGTTVVLQIIIMCPMQAIAKVVFVKDDLPNEAFWSALVFMPR